MGTLSITLIGLLLPVKLYCFENCVQLTNLCPSTKELWEKRTEEFHCWAKDTSYACLLNTENQLVETCIYEVKIEKGVVGCPYVTLCLNGLPQVGTEDKYTECPKNIPGCPDKDHETYTLYELYKYPACFSANKSEILYTTGTTPTLHTTSRIFENKHKTTEGNSFALPIIISGIIVVIAIAAIAAFILIKRERKHSKNHMPLDSHFEEKSPLCGERKHSKNHMPLDSHFEEKSPLCVPVIPSLIHMGFIDDGLLEMTWQPPSDNSEIDSYHVYRKREDKSEWEKLCEVEMTKTKVLTGDVPEWQGFYYGVAANCSQMTGHITWTERPVSERILKEVPVIPSLIHMGFIDDGLLEMTWQPPSDNSEIDSYHVYRKREDKSEWEKLCEVEMTKTKVLTDDVPEWQGFYYGVAANCSQMTGHITWTERPVSERILKEARVTITSLRVEFVVDGVLEVIWEVLSGITDIEYYFILRQKVNKNDWELLDRATSTRRFIFTKDSPTWEYYFYGVAAKRFGRKESVTWTTFPVSENMLKGKATAVGSLYKNNMPEGSNENKFLLETKRLTKSSMSIHARHQELSEQQPQGPRQLSWTLPMPKASEVLTLL